MRVSVLIFFLVVLSGCTRNPITGKREVHIISQEGEMRLGQESKNAIIKEYGLYLNPTVQAYINEVGNRIAAVSERKDVPYEFVILDTSLVNAFAVPGVVFLTRGILDLMDDEAELAAVIGHEVGHITGYHSVKLIQKSYGYGFLAAFAAVAGTVYAPRFETAKEYAAYYETLYRGIGVVTAGFLTGYGRQFELEADRSGLRYGILAGYDPDAMISFFKRLDSLKKGAERDISIFLRTHPPTDERIKQVRRILDSLQDEPSKIKKKKTDREVTRRVGSVFKSGSAVFADHFERYQEVVRSVAKKERDYGGIIKDNVYENTMLGVRLEVPMRWKLEYGEGQSLVSFYSPDGKAEGDLKVKDLQSDAVITAQEAPLFAGTVLSTEPPTSRQWGEAAETNFKMIKRTGRELTYPAGSSYVGTYIGRDRLGRPAFFKILFVIQPRIKNRLQGFILSCAAPEDSYLDYLVDFEKILRSLTFLPALEPNP